MLQIRIELLGPLRVTGPGDETVRLPRGKGAALLAYLAVETDGAERDALASLLWPDAEPPSGRQSLRQALSSLRKLCGADPFQAGDRVALDPAVCRSDVADLRDALAAQDRARAIALFRGAPFTDVDPDLSHDFEAWIDRSRSALLHRLGELLETEGQIAIDAGDDGRAQRLTDLGARCGLDPQVLRAAMHGAHGALPPWSAASVGREALETLVYRLRTGVAPSAALVLQASPGWSADAVRDAAASLPAEGRPTVLVLNEEGAPGHGLLAGLLTALMAAPGGAAVRSDTVRALDEVRALRGAALENGLAARVQAALIDALDAVLEEVPLVVVVPARGMRLQTATLLAHALGLQGAEGLALVLHAPDPHELDGLPVQALATGCRSLRCVRERAPEGRTPGTQAQPPVPAPAITAAGVGWTRRRIALLASAAGVVTILVALGLSRPPAPPTLAELLPDHDILFCSMRSGVPQYYRFSPSTGATERFAADTLPEWRDADRGSCPERHVGAQEGDMVFLLARTPEGQEWRAYPNRWSRRDQKGRTVRAVTQDHFTTMGPGSSILEFDPPGVPGTIRALDMRSGRETRWLWEGGGLAVAGPGSHDPPWWVIMADTAGSLDIYRYHDGTGAVERLTDHPLDEMDPMLRGDSLVFSRGRRGEAEDGSLELFLKHLGSGVEERLTDNSWNDYEVDWSPNGRHLCWQSEELGHYQAEIMVMDLVTRTSWNLSNSPGRDRLCRFSPNGRAVLYESLRTGQWDLFVQPVEGGAAINLSNFPDQDGFVGFVKRRPPTD